METAVLTVQEAIMYVVTVLENKPIRLNEAWRSFNRDLGAENADVTIKDLYTPQVDVSVVDLVVRENVPDTLLESLKTLPDYPLLQSLSHSRYILDQAVCLTAKPTKLGIDHDLQTWQAWRMVHPDQRSSRLLTTTFGNKWNLALNQDFFTIKANTSDHAYSHVGTRDHFLMFSYTVSQRFICLLSSLLAQILDKMDMYPSVKLLRDTFNWGDRIIGHLGNPGYKTISLWEGICISYLLALEEDLATDPSVFFDQIYKSFLDSQDGEHKEFLKHMWDFVQLEILRKCKTPHIITQLFGLFRLWGHPTVDALAGIEKLKSIACKERPFNRESIGLITYKWREYFCLNYYKRNRKWPAMKVNPEAHARGIYLLNHLMQGTALSTQHPDYDVWDWRFMEFEQTEWVR